jgi:anti-sigma regulatory factor (Ser/Thr protein kinase)
MNLAPILIPRMSNPDPQRLILRRELGELDRLAAWIQATEQAVGLGANVAFALELCLEEAVANIIMHGGPRRSGDIAVTVEQTSPALVVRIEDDGLQFDPTRVSPPAAPRSLDDARPGDQGIHLIRTFATDMRYEHRSGLNTLTLTFAAGN